MEGCGWFWRLRGVLLIVRGHNGLFQCFTSSGSRRRLCRHVSPLLHGSLQRNVGMQRNADI